MLFRMPPVVLTGGARARTTSKRRRRSSIITLPKLPRSSRRSRPVNIRSPTAATDSERAALQSLAQRLQRGNFSAWRSANAAQQTAAQTAAATGQVSTATDLLTGTTATATPLSGSGARRVRRKAVARRRRATPLKGGFLPALIPIIAAAIGAIPGIAGTAVGIANLKEQQRQFDRMYGSTAKPSS